DDKVYSQAELVAHGEQVYQSAGCVGCHQANGKGAGSFPALDGSKVVNGPKEGLIALLLNGKPGTAMASFKHLSDKDLAGVSAYIGSAWSNKASELAQPIEFAKVRNGGNLPAGGQNVSVNNNASASEQASGTGSASMAERKIEGLPARIFFASGKKDLPGDAKPALDAALSFLQSKPDAKVDITGYTDKTGNRDSNMELAKERAKTVRDALIAAGVARDRINMKPPTEITGGNDDRAARRVEINPGS
ncbi:MAG: OmpA family protein, partial [Casimicrobiaceae bacterium]